MSKSITKTGLTLKQKRFIQAYLKTGNGAEAVRQAGYKIEGETAEQRNELAATIAYENLRKPDIIKEISKYVTKELISPEIVLNRLHQYQYEADKYSDKIRATELLGKYLHLFGDNQINNYSQINIKLGDTPVQDNVIDTQ